MDKIVIISPEGEETTKEVVRGFEHAAALKEYLDEKHIRYDDEINNGHKLCLDLSREGYWIFRATNSASIMYMGQTISPEQYEWYSSNSYLIDKMNVISIASWRDIDRDSGYDIIEQDSISFNTERKRKDKINDLINQKSGNQRNSKFGFFRRAKK